LTLDFSICNLLWGTVREPNHLADKRFNQSGRAAAFRGPRLTVRWQSVNGSNQSQSKQQQ